MIITVGLRAVAASKSHASAPRLTTSNNAKGLNFGRSIFFLLARANSD
jgi:hypothetical protein